ncbi:MAG: hypothetical protein AAF694_04450 [Bacteroidota bacterium]
MNDLFIQFFLLFKGYYKRNRVDPVQLRAILQTKLMMDGRRVGALMQGMGNSSRSDFSWGVNGILLIVGLVLLFLIYAFDSLMTGLSFYFSFWLFFLGFILVSELITILLDVKDNFILLPKPVSDQTVSFSRLLHIIIYLSKNSLIFMLLAFISFFVTQNVIAAPLFYFPDLPHNPYCGSICQYFLSRPD